MEAGPSTFEYSGQFDVESEFIICRLLTNRKGPPERFGVENRELSMKSDEDHRTRLARTLDGGRTERQQR